MNLQDFLASNPDEEFKFHWQIFKRDKKCYICSLEIEGVGYRHETLKRPGYFCPYGILNEEYIWFNVDHIVPRSSGGPNTYDNVRACCIPCNGKKAAKPPTISDNKEVPSDYENKILKRFYDKNLDQDLPPWEPYYGF